MIGKRTLNLLLLLTASVVNARRNLVLFGPDDRKNEDDPSVDQAQKALGQSTIVLIGKGDLTKNGDVFQLSDSATTIQEERGNQCDGTPWNFGDELNPGGCSGTLIADRLVATAGHCLPSLEACENHYVVFGATNTQVATRQFPASHVFDCQQLVVSVHQIMTRDDTSIYRQLMQAGITPDTGTLAVDFAVVQLDRDVPTQVATPAKVRTNQRVQLGEEIIVIGHPEGLPRKYCKSNVNFVGHDHGGGYIWTAPLDTFGGNSGSGVFSLETNELVGIHYAGNNDFVEEDSCSSYDRCPDNNPSPAADPDFIARLASIDNDDDFEILLDETDFGCNGELQYGSTVLSAPLIQINGCSSNDDCRNGGNCEADGTCTCLLGFFGADCSQERSRVLCNGVGENIGYYECGSCPDGTAPPFCHVCGAESMLEEGCYQDDEELLDDCTCDSSCKSCGFGEGFNSAEDCRSCNSGGELQSLFDDGTGQCVYDSGTEKVCRDADPVVNYCGTSECFKGWAGLSQRERCLETLEATSNCDPDEPEVDFCGANDAPVIRALMSCPGASPVETPPPATSPVETPVESPAESPTGAPNPAACFSGQSSVLTKDRGTVQIREIKVGDEVLVDGNGRFEPVYSLAKRNRETTLNFLKVFVDNQRNPVELTDDHMVWSVGTQSFLQARYLSVGDELLAPDNAIVTIKRITRSRARGYYAPLTFSGKLIVDGVLVSAYAFDTTGNLEIAGFDTGIPAHWFVHAALSPHRLMCYFSLDLCKMEEYEKDGKSKYFAVLNRIYDAWMRCGVFFGFLSAVPLSVALMVLNLLEWVLFVDRSSLASVVALLAAGAYCTLSTMCNEGAGRGGKKYSQRSKTVD